MLSDFRGEDNSLKMPISLSENSIEHSLEQPKQSEESTVPVSEKESRSEDGSESPKTEEGNMG